MLFFDRLLLVVDKSFDFCCLCQLPPSPNPHYFLTYPSCTLRITPIFSSVSAQFSPLLSCSDDHRQTCIFFSTVKHPRSAKYIRISVFCSYSIAYLTVIRRLTLCEA